MMMTKKRKKIPAKYFIPLYLIFISLIIFTTSDFNQAKQSPVTLTNLHKVLSIPLTIALIVYYLFRKKYLPKVPCAIKSYSAYILIAFIGSILCSQWLGYSLYKFTELFAVFLVVIYSLSLNKQYTNTPLYFYDKILIYYKFLIIITIVGVFVYPDLAIRPPSLYREAYLPFQLFGSIVQINANSLGVISAILFFVSFLRIYENKKILSKNVIWLLIALIVLIFAQSRTAVIGLLIAIFLFLLLNKQSKFLGKIFMISMFVAGLALSISSIIKYLQRGLTSTQIENLSGRMYWWKYAWNEFQTYDIIHQLLGSGYMVGSRLILTEMGHSNASTLHSDYMDALISTGYIGLFFLILTVICTFFIIIKNLHLISKDIILLEIAGVLLILTIRSFTGPTISTHNFFLITYLILIAALFTRLKHLKGRGNFNK